MWFTHFFFLDKESSRLFIVEMLVSFSLVRMKEIYDYGKLVLLRNLGFLRVRSKLLAIIDRNCGRSGRLIRKLGGLKGM